jgi:predicted nuclease of predicted toxin-antitoxin system
MNVLLDECLPRRLKRELPGYAVSTVPEMGWAGAKNGTQVRLAETTFEVFVTIDQNLAYQQNLRSVVLGIVVLVAANNRLQALRPLMPKVAVALHTIQPGDLIRITL